MGNTYVKRETHAGVPADPPRDPGNTVKLTLIPLVMLGLPLAEIAVFVAVGSQIGVLATIGLVIATAIVGAVLLRVQGFGAMQNIRLAMAQQRAPGRELVHGAMIVLAGVLLLLPGFITDTLGFLLFIPVVREWAWRVLARNVTIVTPAGPIRPDASPRARRTGGPQIDLEADDFTRSADPGSSPWRDDRR